MSPTRRNWQNAYIITLSKGLNAIEGEEPSGAWVDFSSLRAREFERPGWLAPSTSRNVMICSIALENKRSGVQPMITRSFLANRGSFSRYTVRQSHQAMKPENLIPNTMATPVRRTMVAKLSRFLKDERCWWKA